jgi:hypothetical protein
MIDITGNKLQTGDCIVVAIGGDLDISIYLGKGSWYNDKLKNHIEIDSILEYISIYLGHSKQIKKFGLYPSRLHSSRSSRICIIDPKTLDKQLYNEYLKINNLLKNGYTRDRNK